jgi:hypothetical protein
MASELISSIVLKASTFLYTLIDLQGPTHVSYSLFSGCLVLMDFAGHYNEK